MKMKKKPKKAKPSSPAPLPLEERKRLLELADRGSRLRKEKRREEAIRVWQEALETIPEPRQDRRETADFLSAMGNAYQAGGQYTKALACFRQVLANTASRQAAASIFGAGQEDPYTLRALGEIAWETGDPALALEYLGRAYALEDEVFFPDPYGEIDHQKYFDLLKAHLSKGDTK